MKTVHLQLIGGVWLINGKKYAECDFSEQLFFREFLLATNINEKGKTDAPIRS